MNNEIITYILHFEIPNNCLAKDNIYFNNNYCEIIKKENAACSASSLFTCFTRGAWGVENTIVKCVKNNIYDFFTKPKHIYDDIIRL